MDATAVRFASFKYYFKLKYAFMYTYLFGNDRFTGFNSRAIMLDGVVDITQSILSTGWNPLSEIVGFLFEEDQLAYVEQLKHNCDSENFQVQLQKFMEGMFQYYSSQVSKKKIFAGKLERCKC